VSALDKTIEVPCLGGDVAPVTTHQVSAIDWLPEKSEGFMMWDDCASKKHVGQIVGYVKRYHRYNPRGGAYWHVVPFHSARDRSIEYQLYIGSR
jgi:hypothetical protein